MKLLNLIGLRWLGRVDLPVLSETERSHRSPGPEKWDHVEEGKSVPVIVHGAVSDGGYWADQLPEFAKHYRAISAPPR